MGNNLFQSLKRRASQALGLHLLRRKGSAASAAPLAARHNPELCDSASHILWEQT